MAILSMSGLAKLGEEQFMAAVEVQRMVRGRSTLSRWKLRYGLAPKPQTIVPHNGIWVLVSASTMCQRRVCV